MMEHELTPRERFLQTHHIAKYMKNVLMEFLQFPYQYPFLTRLTQLEYRNAAQLQAAAIHGAAGVIVCLMNSGDKDVRTGIRALQLDLRVGNLQGLCNDPILYYCKQKAIASICRPYYYFTSDAEIINALKAPVPEGFIGYSELPVGFGWGPVSYWLLDALAESDYSYVKVRRRHRSIEEWVMESFPVHLCFEETWPCWTKIKHADYDNHFLADDRPLCGPVDEDIASMLRRETEQYKLAYPEEDYRGRHYGNRFWPL